MPNAQPGRSGAAAWTTWAVSLVNGAFGDYLHTQQNELAITMACYHGQRPFLLTPAAIARVHPHATARVCVLVHGLGCHEGLWAYAEPGAPSTTTYGELLQRDLGYTPFYVRYNTGLALAENGRQLAALLETLTANYPLPVAEILLIGHSMGGLVIRHACHQAIAAHAAWAERVQRVIYLGSPHDGALLAQVGHVATAVLHAVPHPITQLIGDIFHRRSQGVKDLRHGAIHAPEAGTPVGLPWLPHAQHYFAVGALTEDPRHVSTVIFGDGLVRPHEAGAVAHRRHGQRPLPLNQVKRFPGIHHLQLAHDPAVYDQIYLWCAASQETGKEAR